MELLTVAQVAEELGLAVPTVTLWCRERKILGAHKIGRDWLIPKTSLEMPDIRNRVAEIQGRRERDRDSISTER